MSARAPLVGTVILDFHSADDTVACVSAVLQSTELDQHVIVADNTEDAAAREALAARLPAGVEYLPLGRNLGYAGGNNVAIARLLELGVRYLWVLNPDVRAAPTTLRRMLDTMREHGDIGILGPRVTDGDVAAPKILSDGGRVDRAKYGRTYHDRGGKPVAGLSASLVPVDYVTGACMLVDARVVRTVGFIPEEFFLYFEETDFCRRAIEYGWAPSVDRRIAVSHYRRSSGWLPSAHYMYYMVRNRALFVQRLGLDDPDSVDRAYADLHETFIDPWRGRVEAREPGWLPQFDRLVAQAKIDGRGGRTGSVDLDAIADIDAIAGSAGSAAIAGIAGSAATAATAAIAEHGADTDTGGTDR